MEMAIKAFKKRLCIWILSVVLLTGGIPLTFAASSGSYQLQSNIQSTDDASSTNYSLCSRPSSVGTSGTSASYNLSPSLSCALCGNGVLETGESCDGANLNGQSCASQGFAGGGILSCSVSCTFNTTACNAGGGGGGGGGGGSFVTTTSVTPAVCGNRLLETGETCDDGNRKNRDGCNAWCRVEKSKKPAAAVLTQLQPVPVTKAVAPEVPVSILPSIKVEKTPEEKPLESFVEGPEKSLPAPKLHVNGLQISDETVPEKIYITSTLTGKTEEAATVKIHSTLLNKTFEVKTDENNQFSFTYPEKLVEGVSDTVSIVVETPDGRTSQESIVLFEAPPEEIPITAEISHPPVEPPLQISIKSAAPRVPSQQNQLLFAIAAIFTFVMIAFFSLAIFATVQGARLSAVLTKPVLTGLLSLIVRVIVFALIIAAILFLFSLQAARAATTTPNIINYEGILKNPAGAPIITAQDFRFSLWSDSDYDAPADFDGTGAIPGAAPGFSGYQEVRTLTPNASGFFQLQVGTITPIPNFNTTQHLFLQVEVKANGTPNTSFELLDFDGVANATDRQAIATAPFARNADLLDNADVGINVGNIPTLGAGNVLPFSTIPGGTNADDFLIDTDGNAPGVTRLSFGTILQNRILTFDPNGAGAGNGWFNFNDDVNVQGNVTLTGTIKGSTGPLSVGNVRIINVLDPTAAQDAATKKYVDDFVNGLSWKDPIEQVNQLVNGGAGVGGIRAGGKITVTDETLVNALNTIAFSYNAGASNFTLTAKDAPIAASCEFKSGVAATSNADMATSILNAINACATASDFAGQSTVSGTSVFVVHDTPGTVGNGTITPSGAGFTDNDMDQGTPFASLVLNETRISHETQITYTWNSSINQWVQITGVDAIPPATTTTRGTVELATDGENAANVVVQGNDSRLHIKNTDTGTTQDSFILNSDGANATLQFGQNPNGQVVFDDVADTFDFDNNKLVNVKDPTSLQDVATKNYVDSVVNGLIHKNPVQHVNQFVNGGAGVGGIRAGGKITVTDETQVAANAMLSFSFNAGASNFTLTAKDAPVAANCEFKSGTAAANNNDMATSILAAIDACAGAAVFSGQSSVSGASVFVVHDNVGTVGNGTITPSGAGFTDVDMAEGAAFAALVANETRLSLNNDASFSWNATSTQWVQITGAGGTPDATTTSKGKVELATDGENAANVVVQGNDSRLHFKNTDTGSTANTFVLDNDDTGGNVKMQFGTTLNESLLWDSAQAYFSLSDSLVVGGNLRIHGNAFTLDFDNVGAGANVDIIAEQGTDLDGTLRYNATTDRWELSNNGAAFQPIVVGLVQKNDVLIFYPEYPDTVIFKDGTNNKGTLDTSYDDPNDEHFYRWTTQQGTTQDITLKFRFALPADFTSVGNFTFKFRTATVTEADNDVEVSIFNATDETTGNPTLCAADLTNTSANVWTSATITAATINTGCTGVTALNANDIIEVQIQFFAKDGGIFTDAGVLQLDYNN